MKYSLFTRAHAPEAGASSGTRGEEISRDATDDPVVVSETSVLGDPARAAQLAEILKAVAHPVRLRIIAILCDGPQHVGALAGALGLKQAIVSQQLRILRMRGLVVVERAGGFARYSLGEPRLRQLVSCIEGCSVK
jgi:ArsR family transcriptional regulator